MPSGGRVSHQHSTYEGQSSLATVEFTREAGSWTFVELSRLPSQPVWPQLPPQQILCVSSLLPTIICLSDSYVDVALI